MTGRRRWWWWRLAGGVVAFGAIDLFTRLIHGRVDELRLALVVALVVSAAALLVDASPVDAAYWAAPPAESESGLSRLDPRTASYLRVLESHRSARDVDAALSNRLRQLAAQTLLARHDLTMDDPRAEPLLGPDLRRVLNEAPTKLDRDQIDRCVTRIEEL
jgi:hypothetical protein